MGLRKLRLEVHTAENRMEDQRQRAGLFVANTVQRVKGWFGPWRIISAGVVVGGVAGWRQPAQRSDRAETAEQQSSPGDAKPTASHAGGSRFSALIDQTTQVVQLISLAMPLMAQFTPLAQALSGAEPGPTGDKLPPEAD